MKTTAQGVNDVSLPSFPKSLSFFGLALASFYIALTFRFRFFIFEQNESFQSYVIIFLFTLLSGFFLGLSFKILSPLKEHLRVFLEGLGLALSLILIVSSTESILSGHFYQEHTRPEEFSKLTGHCGIYAGRSIFKILHQQEDTPREGAYQEFRLDDQCRIFHFAYLMKHKVKLCEENEDPVECQVRWMGSFAEHGYWNQQTRKFFFDQVMKEWANSKKEDGMVQYVLKDQELEAAKQSILKQAGIDETMNDRFLLIQDKEDLGNLILSRDIFNQVSTVVIDTDTSPPPYLFKFRDAMANFQPKLARIPELEKDIQQMEAGEKL